ncbi:hypothetical protein ACLSZR_10400, partial [Avibacterium avium]
IVRTPDTNPEDFSRKKGDRGQTLYINKYTGEKWSISDTKHSDKNGEWKVGLNRNEPERNRKITIGRSDGKIIKK